MSKENTILQSGSQPTTVEQVVQTGIYSGPIPPPQVLAGFRELMPDLPERIVKMAEIETEADVRRIDRESSSIGRGQVFSFVLGMAGFGLAAVFALKGMETGAIAAALGGVAPIIVAAIGNLRK
jgi:uncharacterized membrane protein